MSQFPPAFLRRAAIPAVLALLLTAPAAAQDPTPATGTPASAPTFAQAAPSADAAFQRARRLVSEGHGAAGRAIVDSVLAAVAPASAAAAEALWWRASLAATATDAERDYRRLAVEYPVSPRAEDALLRLAQLELTRGDREQAVRHLERLALEHPNGASRPRASYWMSRIKFEMNDSTGACAAIAQARASTPPEEVELRNQIDFTARRCARFEAARLADSTALAAAATSGGVASSGAPVSGAPATTHPTGAPAASAPAAAATTAPTITAPTTRPSAGTGSSPAATPPVASPPSRTTATATPATTARTFAVQVAAFDTRRAADALVAKLKAGGHSARVDGSAAPFRVRVGRYRTREAAVSAQKELAQKKIAGFVVAEGGAQ